MYRVVSVCLISHSIVTFLIVTFGVMSVYDDIEKPVCACNVLYLIASYLVDAFLFKTQI